MLRDFSGGCCEWDFFKDLWYWKVIFRFIRGNFYAGGYRDYGNKVRAINHY